MWSIYIIRCNDNSLYTGISNNVSHRFKIHQSGSVQAAKYTRNKHPLQLVFTAEIGDRSAASRAEYRIKQLSKRSKELLVAGKTSLSNLGIIETKVISIVDRKLC
jgi:putative endonuclease